MWKNKPDYAFILFSPACKLKDYTNTMGEHKGTLGEPQDIIWTKCHIVFSVKEIEDTSWKLAQKEK